MYTANHLQTWHECVLRAFLQVRASLWLNVYCSPFKTATSVLPIFAKKDTFNIVIVDFLIHE